MKVLMAHNKYAGAQSGETTVYNQERKLLEEHGHDVITYEVDNSNINVDDSLKRIKLASKTIWSQETYLEVEELIKNEQPQVVHCHNTFPLISPAIYYVAKKYDCATVQTIHNYRFICPMGQFLRDGSPCEDCLGKKIPWPAIYYKCYRDDRAASATVSGMLATHKLINTYAKKIDQYILLTDFARDKFIADGFPKEKLSVKPNFLQESPEIGKHDENFALFVGRVSNEKGIEFLIEAWRQLDIDLDLRIVGNGPLLENLKGENNQANVMFEGEKSHKEVLQFMQKAKFLIFPSIWYEGMPMTIVESFATGLPVIGSNIGAMKTLIQEKKTGVKFEPGSPEDIVKKVKLVDKNENLLKEMSVNARNFYEDTFTAESNYKLLMEIYDKASSEISA